MRTNVFSAYKDMYNIYACYLALQYTEKCMMLFSTQFFRFGRGDVNSSRLREHHTIKRKLTDVNIIDRSKLIKFIQMSLLISCFVELELIIVSYFEAILSTFCVIRIRKLSTKSRIYMYYYALTLKISLKYECNVRTKISRMP